MESTKGYLYSTAQIAGGTFLGTPIAGCLLAAHNFRELNQKEMATKTVIGGLVVTVILLIISFFLPENFPNTVIPMAYTVAVSTWANQRLGEAYKKHIESGGTRGSNWKVVGIGFGCLAIIFIAICLVVLVMEPS